MAFTVSAALVAEYATVDAVLASSGTTRRVDALVLCWVKYEKQTRRLFCFLVFQHPRITRHVADSYIKVLVTESSLYPESFLRGFDLLAPQSMRVLLGERHTHWQKTLRRIKGYRNKLLHGQITGLDITSRQLERDIRALREWARIVSEACQGSIGYDGIARNTFRRAKEVPPNVNRRWPFDTPETFRTWLRRAVIPNHGA